MSLRPKTRLKVILERGCAECVEDNTATREKITTMPTMPSPHSGLRVSTASTPTSKPAMAVPPFWPRYQGISANRGNRVKDWQGRGSCTLLLKCCGWRDRLPACQQTFWEPAA